MTLIRAQTFGRMVSPVADCRGRIGAKGVQVYGRGGMVWAKKAMISRNAPCTIEIPHLGQIQWRIKFGEAAQRHKGSTGFVEGLPAVAAAVKRELTGGSAPDKMRPEEYSRMTYHSVEELKRMERRKRAAVRVPRPEVLRGLPV